MTNATEPTSQTLEELSLLCGMLAPFFIQDPETQGQDCLAAIRNIDPIQAGAQWPFAPADEATRALSQMRDALGQDPDNAQTAREYRRLFFGPGTKEAPLWGSVYTDRESVIFGATTLALRTWVRTNGVPRATDGSTPDDHFGLMLLQLSWLCDHKPQLVAEYLREHLLTWAYHFLDVVDEATCSPFYHGLAALTRASLAGVQARLGLEVQTPRFFR